MGKPYSLDLRERIIGFVEGGRSRRRAAEHFNVSPSCAIKLMERWDRTGSAAPGRRGGSVGKLAAYKDFLLRRVKDKPDITLPRPCPLALGDFPAFRSRARVRTSLR